MSSRRTIELRKRNALAGSVYSRLNAWLNACTTPMGRVDGEPFVRAATGAERVTRRAPARRADRQLAGCVDVHRRARAGEEVIMQRLLVMRRSPAHRGAVIGLWSEAGVCRTPPSIARAGPLDGLWGGARPGAAARQGAAMARTRRGGAPERPSRHCRPLPPVRRLIATWNASWRRGAARRGAAEGVLVDRLEEALERRERGIDTAEHAQTRGPQAPSRGTLPASQCLREDSSRSFSVLEHADVAEHR